MLCWSRKRRLYPMATAKEEARKVLARLPDEASLEEIQHHLRVLQCIERGQRAVESDRVAPQVEIGARMA